MLIFSDPKAVLAVFLVVALVLGALGYGIAWGMSYVGLTAARVWAVLATLGLPLCMWIGIRIGNNGARAHLRGIDDGLEKVSKAAAQVHEAGTKAIDLRGQAAFAMRRAAQPQPEVVVDLPRLDGHYQVLDALPSGEEVELG